MKVKGKEWIVLPGMYEEYRKFSIVAEDYLSKEPLFHKQPILLVGDSGVGKSLFIEKVRQLSLVYGMSDGSIVRLNCAAFTNELAESEIFGHLRGAFTGATENKKGLVEVADGGLLILDEIGELSDEIQAKLLIFIEEGDYRPVGGNKYKKASLKIIGTTNKSQDFFREDFWYRFFPIFIPPVYERRLDVLYFIAHKYPDVFNRLTPQHALALLAYNWPGNIREIERVISLMMLEDCFASVDRENSGADEKLSWKPLYFPVDKRQTLLSLSSLHDFFVRLANCMFDVSKLNKIISKYGIAIPISFDVTGPLFETFVEIKKCVAENIDDILNVIDENIPDIDCPKHDFHETDSYKKFTNILSSAPLSFKLMEQISLYEESFYRSLFLPKDFDRKDRPNEGVCICQALGRIESIGIGFNCLCRLFLKNPRSDKDVFGSSEHYIADTCWTLDLEKQIFKQFYRHNLVKQSLEFLTGNSVVVKYDCSFNESWKMHVMQILDKTAYDSLFAKSDETEVDFELFDLNEDELLERYYKYLIDKHKTRRKAAEHAGLKYSTFLKRLNSLGFTRRGYDRGKQ